MGNEVIVAPHAGFCFGVKKAVDSVYEAIGSGERIAVLGELIHNRQVIEDLQRRGVVTLSSADACPPGCTLVIRTHGEGRAVIEQAQRAGRTVCDLTCPNVKRIHAIVEKYSAAGYGILIIGDASHPEVVGICGWCSGPYVVIDSEAALETVPFSRVCAVAQTTSSRRRVQSILRAVKARWPDALVFDTVCRATQVRQQEAEELAGQVDLMLVIGGRSSSNTAKLYDICKRRCSETYYIENFEDIPQNINYKNKKIGITAGASTPAGIIEEVAKAMDENKVSGEINFEEALEQTLKTLNTGDIVEGTVVEVRPTEVIVDLGFKSDGIIPASELSDDPDVSPSDVVKPGEKIQVFVVGVNDGEGKTLLSKKKLDAIAGWKSIEEAAEDKRILSGKVVQVVKGGMIVLVDGTRVFVPARQASDRYVEDLSIFLNQPVELRVIDINPRRHRVVGSVRSVVEEKKEAMAKAFWESAEVGKKYTGTVKSIMPFGVFVDLGGVDGLVHISELSWHHVKHPSEVVKVGDSMEVYIKELNQETNKVSLGYKKAEDNPWYIAQNKFNVGDVVTCKVVRFMTFGAFVELIPGVDGLVHISQIADHRIKEPAEVLKIGQEVTAKILGVDWTAKRISLSIRAVLEEEAAKEAAQVPTVMEETVYKDGETTFEPEADEAADAAETTDGE